MTTLSLEIYTPREILAREQNVANVCIPAFWGNMELLPCHADYITKLTQGELSYKSQKGDHHTFNISGGLVTVKNGKVTVLADALIASVSSIEDAKRKKSVA